MMNTTRVVANRTPEDRERHRAIRETFQRERPTMEQLIQSGEYIGPMPLAEVFSLLEAMHELKKSREAAGLSLADVAERTGIDKAALSRLETGGNSNPTIETLSRYAAAIGKRLRWTVVDAAAAD